MFTWNSVSCPPSQSRFFIIIHSPTSYSILLLEWSLVTFTPNRDPQPRGGKSVLHPELCQLRCMFKSRPGFWRSLQLWNSRQPSHSALLTWTTSHRCAWSLVSKSILDPAKLTIRKYYHLESKEKQKENINYLISKHATNPESTKLHDIAIKTVT